MPLSNRARADGDKERSSKSQEQELKRARGAISCAECRRLKLKCDKTVPCSSCKRRGCASICPNGSLTTGQGTRYASSTISQRVGESGWHPCGSSKIFEGSRLAGGLGSARRAAMVHDEDILWTLKSDAVLTREWLPMIFRCPRSIFCGTWRSMKWKFSQTYLGLIARAFQPRVGRTVLRAFTTASSPSRGASPGRLDALVGTRVTASR